MKLRPSPLYQRPFTAQVSAKHSRKRQLHTTHAGAAGWEPRGSSPTTCAGKADQELPWSMCQLSHAGNRRLRRIYILWQLYTVLYREIIIFCAAFLREYSYICSHVLPFTSFYAMFSPGKFKVPLTLTVKKKRIVHFEGLLEFKWSDLGEQDVVGQGSFGAVFMVFHSNG